MYSPNLLYPLLHLYFHLLSYIWKVRVANFQCFTIVSSSMAGHEFTLEIGKPKRISYSEVAAGLKNNFSCQVKMAIQLSSSNQAAESQELSSTTANVKRSNSITLRFQRLLRVALPITVDICERLRWDHLLNSHREKGET